MSHVTVVALAWTLVHFIWQGAAIALIAGGAGAVLRSARPTTRYVVFCAAFLAMALLPLITFVVMSIPTDFASAPAAPASAAPAVSVVSGSSTSPSPAGPVWFDWLVGVWLSGVAIVGLHSFVGWVLAQRLKRVKTAPAAESVLRVARSLRIRLGIGRAVRVLVSAVAEVPGTLGWLRPVILLPISAVTALTPEQIELLIAHELAHVRRHDYLVNLAQTAVETVLFYHPAVWWVSGRIRAERENCCDDLAVAACGNVPQYVRALALLEELRARRPKFVVAANGGSLLSRIERLLNRGRTSPEAPPAWLAAVVPAALVFTAIVSATPPQAVAGSPPKPEVQTSGFLGGLTDAGYTHLSVDEIIALKEHGVEPRFVKDMLSAGLGVPTVEQLIRLREHGVEPGFVAGMVMSDLVSDLGFATVIPLRENDARGDDMLRIRALGFGPFSSDEVIKLRQSGADAATFTALKEAGADRAGVADAITFRQNDITAGRIRDMKRQGFNNLSLEQIVKLRRSGII